MLRILSSLFIIAIISISCAYNSEETLYPEVSGCDSLNVTYTKNILPILESNCLSCHANSVSAEKGGHLILEGYSNVADLSEAILASINHVPGAKEMPKDAAKLDDCLIRQFGIWVETGKPE